MLCRFLLELLGVTGVCNMLLGVLCALGNIHNMGRTLQGQNEPWYFIQDYARLLKHFKLLICKPYPRLDFCHWYKCKCFHPRLRSLFTSFNLFMGLGNIHLCTFDCLAIGWKCIIIGLPCVLWLLFKVFESPNFVGPYFAHFFKILVI
jgi:hypothetical protein